MKKIFSELHIVRINYNKCGRTIRTTKPGVEERTEGIDS